MALIRFVDAWLRSPASSPTAYRSVMVIAEKWAEQRVLMRAFAQSRDQTLPSILLHGNELAIGPAGLEPDGPWGIHVGDGPEGFEARAQAVKNGLEEAARRLAGSKGNPPRLADEESTFDRVPTGNWTEGTPRVLPRDHRGPVNPPPRVDFVAPVGAARVPQQQVATYVTQVSAVPVGTAPVNPVAAPSSSDLRLTPVPRASNRKTRPPPLSPGRTALGYSSGSGAQSVIVRLGLTPQVSAQLGRLVDRVVPGDFQINPRERQILNALGEQTALPARTIAQILDVVDAVTVMEALLRKLESFGLGDLVEPAEPQGGEPTYRLRR